ncbi:MAG: hypothetical protein ACTSO7_16400, partial [Candidatus Heimdallarchaeota archaeon]
MIYEEEQDEVYNIFQRTRLAGNTTWEDAIQITNDGKSFDPILLQNTINSSTNFGQLFYITENSVLTQSYNLTENWQPECELFRTSEFEDDPSFVIDSEGTMHIVVEHIALQKREIRYLRKELGESWEFVESLTEEWWLSATSPFIITDSFDNLHCIFIAEEEITHRDTLFYRTLN